MFGRYLREKRSWILQFFFLLFLFSFTLLLLDFPARLIGYPAFLCTVLFLLFLAGDYVKVRKKHRWLLRLKEERELSFTEGQEDEDILGRDYQELIGLLQKENRRQRETYERNAGEMIDYYTTWAHQIKTPISAMKLTLQNEDSPLSRQLLVELFRIEQYVEMVLAYLRLGAEATDYVFRECDTDEMLRQTVKKFSSEFILRKLHLEYSKIEHSFITDEKWFCFVLEQILSNALKYTREGGIEIFMEEPETLCIRDSGIGIRPEDLPRIFERGYTGGNGRMDKKASGIGLYLCREVCRNLGISIGISSVPEKGTTVRLDLSQHRIERE